VGGVWIGNPPFVDHVDPLTETIRARIHVGGGYAATAVGFRTVWVSVGDELDRINPATDEVLRPIPLSGSSAPFFSTWIAVGEGSVWAMTDVMVYEVDPVQGRVARTIDQNGNGIAVGEGAVWVVDNLAGELVRIGPDESGDSTSTSLPGSLDAVAAGGGAVWVLDQSAGTVAVVDPATLAVEDTIRVGSDERNIVFGGGAVWLADGGDRSITRIDPLTHATTTFPVGDAAQLVTVDAETGAVWALLG
jgi:YVTN family beta-propeller protein